LNHKLTWLGRFCDQQGRTSVLLLIFTIFCLHLTIKRFKKINKRKSKYLLANDLFICTNEERRRLLINNSFQNKEPTFSKINLNKSESFNIPLIIKQKRNLIKSDFNIQQNISYNFKHSITSNISEQSPPPPRRLAEGGKTQVLPLTGGNQKRVPALILLMADKENKRTFPQQQLISTTSNGYETINEEIGGECDQTTIISEGLMSIDRVFI
ncbi:hypothetical protein Mgra_00009109, partial [Meloidogyne graminicola]